MFDWQRSVRALSLAVRRCAFVALLVAAGCAGRSSSKPAGPTVDMSPAATPDMAPTGASLVAARPYGIDVPAGSDPTQPLPLIVLLHGYGASGGLQDAYFAFATLADDRQVYVAHPDGTIDSTGNRFWNATDACCNIDHSTVDDVAYLNAVVDDVESHYAIDKTQVYFVGHSNGGFMSHRMACEHAERIAAIVALAGDNWDDPSKCNPTQPVSALQVHGDADMTIPYAGSSVYPSAMASIGVWAMKNNCTGGLQDTGLTYDIDSSLPGNETAGAAWTCPAGAAELWTIHGGMHVPELNTPAWGNYVFDWLTAHKRSQ